MTININKLAAASFMPGLQNSGQVNGTAEITGTLNPSGTDGTTSNVTGSFVIVIPDPTVISLLRVNLPDAHGQLVSRWFPLIGTVELTDNTTNFHYRLVMFVQSHPLGRQINYNFVSTGTSDTINFSNYRINFYGHLFSYPWG